MKARATSALVAAALLAGCTAEDPVGPLEQARVSNENRAVSGAFPSHPQVIDDPSGVETARMLFPRSETLVLVDETVTAGLRGASVAMTAHSPLIVYTPDKHREIVEEIQRMGAHTILTVGLVQLAPSEGEITVIRDPGGADALGEMTALKFETEVIEQPEDAIGAIAAVDEDTPTWLMAAWAEPVVGPRAEAKPFPGQSPRDADMAPKVIATPESDLAAVANARSFGAEVTMVSNPDPSASERTLLEVAGLSDQPLLALGDEFGTDAELAARIRAGEVNKNPKPSAESPPSG